MPKLEAGLGLVLLTGLILWRTGGPSSAPNENHSQKMLAGAPVSFPHARRAEHVIAPENPLSQTLAAIQAETDPQRREKALTDLIEGIAWADLPATLEYLQSQGSSELNADLTARLVRRWAEGNSAAAADWVSRLPEGALRQTAVSQVAVAWASQDLKSAMDWARQLPEGAERDNGLQSVAYEAARAEPREALNLAREMSASGQRDDLVLHAVRQWTAEEPEAAAQWAGQIADAAMQERVLSAVATEWGETDPVAAATLAIQGIAPGRAQDDAVIGIVQRWVQRQPRLAAAWVQQFPAGELRQLALETVVKLWPEKNPQ
jgi:hypothetical protein